jgi:hypothetical protein
MEKESTEHRTTQVGGPRIELASDARSYTWPTRLARTAGMPTPVSSTVLYRDSSPDTIVAPDARVVAMRRDTNLWFALPFSGGADIRIFTLSPWSPTT